MSLWFAQPKLGVDEAICWQSSAGRSLNRWITSGGRLLVTDRRILFQPNRLDSATGKKPWECPLSAVTGIEPVNRDPTVLAGGLRKRLGIKTTRGNEAFVVNRLQEKLVELKELIPLK